MENMHQCPECNGRGIERAPLDKWPFPSVDCKNCDGTGWLDEHGEPLFLEPELKEIKE